VETCNYICSTNSQVRIRNGDQWEDKRAQNSTTEVSFCTIIIRFESVNDGDHDGVVRIFVDLSCKPWGFFTLYDIITSSGTHTPGTSGVISGANSCFRNQDDPSGLTVTS